VLSPEAFERFDDHGKRQRRTNVIAFGASQPELILITIVDTIFRISLLDIAFKIGGAACDNGHALVVDIQ